MTSDRRGDFRLLACGRDGQAQEPLANLTALRDEIRQATLDHYDRVGFNPPWIGYFALAGDVVIGGGGFVGPPNNNRVEIAYHTLPDHQSQGYGTRTAMALIAIARSVQPTLEIYAKTAPEQNPSAAILTRLGFRFIGIAIDHEIGEAWAWLLTP